MTARGVFALVLGWALLMLCEVAVAQPRAWLDRGRIALTETVTLRIESTTAGEPDYTPLQRDFNVSGHTSQRRFELVNGEARMRNLYAVSLQPRRQGPQQIPAIAVAGARTAPIPLLVTAGVPQVPARAGDEVFIESQADDTDPYVQQSVGWVVRLYSAVPLVSGQLDQPAPQGASLQRVGEDAQYLRQIGNRRYSVVERRFLLVPERSGVLTMPPALFEGRGTIGFFDSLFNRDGSLRARAAPRFLQVRAMPANAPQPWLPLRGLQLRYREVPRQLKAGIAATLEVELSADGATAAQLPELTLPAIDGVQVLAEPPATDESFVDGRPKARLVRRYSLVPGAAGAARLPSLQLPWFDVQAGRARVATLPPLDWQVQPGRVNVPLGPGDDAALEPASGAVADAEGSGRRTWTLFALALAGAALAAFAWKQRSRLTQPPATIATPGPADMRAPPSAPPRRADLLRLIDTAELREVEHALLTTVQPVAQDLADLASRADDPLRREAIEALQNARWGGGDSADARGKLRAAFSRPAMSARSPRAAPGPLPPLYPDAPD
ncbi:MAG: Aerotolerance protein BatD [uncultured Lysobacter sp.]|uniref:Aerotolerance protein BatD n=1 Tax=uncultured Lysobacter sp. TaxID=271060 RepID=A0A6J4LDI7_9GAMM|nr:MAG: Aerotolerance protein BatD [uncultured Lysobacter sp.]